MSTVACFDSASIWLCNAESRCRSALICAFNCLTTGLSLDVPASLDDDGFRPVDDCAWSVFERMSLPFKVEGAAASFAAEALDGRLAAGGTALGVSEGSTRMADSSLFECRQPVMCLPLYIGMFLRHVRLELEEDRRGFSARKAADYLLDSYIRYKTFDRVGYCD